MSKFMKWFLLILLALLLIQLILFIPDIFLNNDLSQLNNILMTLVIFGIIWHFYSKSHNEKGQREDRLSQLIGNKTVVFVMLILSVFMFGILIYNRLPMELIKENLFVNAFFSVLPGLLAISLYGYILYNRKIQ
ncbi:hypothetical protein [Robertkochia aurantiaca]|uniref:hypothetical protein n=1 Tax=Robertkochia aurantiaca TaxID=2873700 RepID=UPI001CCDACF2|nr:hypothetical protein [Robertkochia sp. 3YJGBD-33]